MKLQNSEFMVKKYRNFGQLLITGYKHAHIQYLNKNYHFCESIMQEYPVFKPENYRGLGLLLSNPPRSTLNNPETQTYVERNTIQPNLTFRSISPPAQGPPVIYAHKPERISRVEERVRNQLVKGDSRIEYVPVEKKVVDYVDEPRYSVVPKKRIVSDYREVKKVDIVPRQVVTTDYYAIEHIRSYVPQVVPEKYVDYIPVEHKHVKYEYIPIERQLVHYPNQHHQEQIPRYLGVREKGGPKVYQNLNPTDVEYWEREYGYVRGQPITVLNQKIRRKVELEKEQYFKFYQSRSTLDRTASQLPFSNVSAQPTQVTQTVPNVQSTFSVNQASSPNVRSETVSYVVNSAANQASQRPEIIRTRGPSETNTGIGLRSMQDAGKSQKRIEQNQKS